MKPFATVPNASSPDRATVRASKVEATHALGAGRGRTTRVTLPDGYVVTLVGAVGKTDAVRAAQDIKATGLATEEK
jgi:hypothetical protein